jgi:hypothetical protein
VEELLEAFEATPEFAEADFGFLEVFGVAASSFTGGFEGLDAEIDAGAEVGEFG